MCSNAVGYRAAHCNCTEGKQQGCSAELVPCWPWGSRQLRSDVVTAEKPLLTFNSTKVSWGLGPRALCACCTQLVFQRNFLMHVCTFLSNHTNAVEIATILPGLKNCCNNSGFTHLAFHYYPRNVLPRVRKKKIIWLHRHTSLIWLLCCQKCSQLLISCLRKQDWETLDHKNCVVFFSPNTVNTYTLLYTYLNHTKKKQKKKPTPSSNK